MLAYLGDMDERNVLAYASSNGEVIELGYSKKHNFTVNNFKYHPPMGDGDKHFIDVYFTNGKVLRDFDVVTVMFG